MTSARQLAANRANAAKSTGPTSRSGKRRSSRNARRHGLSIPIVADPTWSVEIEGIARQIAGPEASQISLELAKFIAAAQLDVLRVRHVRQHLISEALAGAGDFEPPEYAEKRHMIVAAKFPAASTRRMLAALTWRPTTAYNHATNLGTLGEKLEKLDRYERRAISRRNRAIHAYDADRRGIRKGRKSRYCIARLSE